MNAKKHLIYTKGGSLMKIMSNELLVVSYRDAVSSQSDKELINHLKQEIQRRGLQPYKK